MMSLKEAVRASGITYRPFAKRLKMSVTQFERMVNHGEYPKRTPRQTVIEAVKKVLWGSGINSEEVRFPVRFREAPVAANQTVDPELVEEIELMQLDKSVLRFFGLTRNPFVNDVEDDSDVFRFSGYDRVERSLLDCVDERGFVALVSGIGAGKTTIWDGVESELMRRDDVVICRPYLKEKESMKPGHLCHALIRGLVGEEASIPHNAEEMSRMLSRALIQTRTESRDVKALLYIDDAHFCNRSVLRQLKAFYEEKVGRFRLLGIILVGIEDLTHKLAAFPEIGNRIRVVQVPPVPAEKYLRFKFVRAGSDLSNVFSGDGLKAFCDRFRVAKNRVAVGRPLQLNAAAIRAMCKLVDNGAQPGERITREIIDQLPGGPARRAA